MQNSFLRIILIGVASFFIYRYRYRLINIILGQSLLRRLVVKSFMQIPFVREQMVGQMFRFQ
ncbi:MAG TPA: hypothetical protein GX497_07310 [Bacillus bacterium]|nr:hypothetical protein [Bacillus sp. (in: firmicutes)]